MWGLCTCWKIDCEIVLGAGRNLPWSSVIKYSASVGFPGGSAGKESSCNVEHLSLIPGLGRSPEEGNGHPLQYSGLENSMDCTIHGVAKSWTRPSNFHFTSVSEALRGTGIWNLGGSVGMGNTWHLTSLLRGCECSELYPWGQGVGEISFK